MSPLFLCLFCRRATPLGCTKRRRKRRKRRKRITRAKRRKNEQEARPRPRPSSSLKTMCTISSNSSSTSSSSSSSSSSYDKKIKHKKDKKESKERDSARGAWRWGGAPFKTVLPFLECLAVLSITNTYIFRLLESCCESSLYFRRKTLCSRSQQYAILNHMGVQARSMPQLPIIKYVLHKSGAVRMFGITPVTTSRHAFLLCMLFPFKIFSF